MFYVCTVGLTKISFFLVLGLNYQGGSGILSRRQAKHLGGQGTAI